MVEINELCLTAYGKFENYSIKFNDGFSIIYGVNEAGKSTIQSFIRAMFYGFPKQRKINGVMRDRERALPWHEKKARGVVRLQWNARSLEIRREFGKTASGDKIEVLDQHTGELIPELSIPDLGRKLLDMPESVFEKTVWISQEGSCMGGKNEELSARLINLCRTGDADISITKAREYLNQRKISLQAKDKRNNAGEIDLLKARKEALQQEKYILESQSRQRVGSQEQIKKKKEQLKEIETDICQYEALQKAELCKAHISRVNQLLTLKKQCDEILNDKLYQLYHRSAMQDTPEIEKITDTLKALDLDDKISYDKENIQTESDHMNKKIWLGWTVLLFGMVLLLTGLLFLVVPVSRLWAFTLAICGAAVLVTGGTVLYQAKKYLSVLKQDSERMEQITNEKSEKKQQLKDSLKRYLNRYAVGTAEEFFYQFKMYQSQEERRNLIESTYLALLGGDELDSLCLEAEKYKTSIVQTDLSPDDIESRLMKLRTEQNLILQDIRDIENKVAYEYTSKTNLADLESEIALIEQDLIRLNKKYQALDLAQSVMEEAYQQMKSDFTPQVNERVNDTLTFLTSGAHGQVKVSEEFYLKVVEDENDLREAEYFSAGTYQQIYFALRMSIANLIIQDNIPLFLDDMLMAYDDERAEKAIRYLADQGSERQVFLFTCHKRDYDYAKGIGANLIEI